MSTQSSVLNVPVRYLNKHTIVVLSVFLTFGLFTYIGLTHPKGQEYGWLSLLPTTLVLVFALTTHRTVEALFCGTIAGALMLNPDQAVKQIVARSQQ